MLRLKRRSRDVLIITEDSFSGSFPDHINKNDEPLIPDGELRIAKCDKPSNTLLYTMSDDQSTQIYLRGELMSPHSMSDSQRGLQIRNVHKAPPDQIVSVLDPDGNFIFQGAGPVPLPPSHLETNVISFGCIELSWLADSTDHDGFSIKRKNKTKDGTYTQYEKINTDTVPAYENTYKDNDITPGTKYVYHVLSLRGDLQSPPSDEVAVLTALSPPLDLFANVRDDYIYLSWKPLPSDWRSGVSIERSVTGKGEDYEVIHEQSPYEVVPEGVTPFYKDDDLQENYDDYAYRVKAYNPEDDNYSAASVPTGVTSQSFKWCEKELNESFGRFSQWPLDHHIWTRIVGSIYPQSNIENAGEQLHVDVFTDFEQRTVEIAYEARQQLTGYDRSGNYTTFWRHWWKLATPVGGADLVIPNTSMLCMRVSWPDKINLPCNVRVSVRSITEYEKEERLKELKEQLPLMIAEIEQLEAELGGSSQS